jgi:hypothetical protein
MKKTKIIFWTATIIFALLMLASGIPDILNLADAKKFMAALGYPAYLTPFLGWAKLLGVIAILVPGSYPRIKEWAYAGLFIDLTGALYSNLCTTGASAGMLMMLIWVVPGIVSYIYYHKRLNEASK